MTDKVKQFEQEVHDEATRLVNKVPSTSQPLYIKLVTLTGVCAPPHLALVDDAILNERNQHGDTALHVAAARGHDKAFAQLREWGASPSGRGHRLRTVLHHAAANGHLEIVRNLVKCATSGSSLVHLDARDMDGATALALAVAVPDLTKRHQPSYVTRGHWDIVSMLIENQASIDLSDEHGDTPITRAAKTAQWELVKVLIGKGASVETCKNPEESVLALAAKDGKIDLLLDLFRRGSPCDVAQAKSALKMAKNATVVWVIVNAAPQAFLGGCGNEALLCAAADGRLAALEALLQVGVDAHALGPQGRSALSLATIGGHAECVRKLKESESSASSGSAY